MQCDGTCGICAGVQIARHVGILHISFQRFRLPTWILRLCTLLLQSQGQLTIDQQGIVWRKSGGGRKLELPKKGEAFQL